jgi:hypothetical protein
MRAIEDAVSGQWLILEGDQRILQYNYETVQPGDALDLVSETNLKYAQPRSNYIHPLYGPRGEVLTKDWSPDHPHHRGIYWAWPEVDFGDERGDLHALQVVFARPTGQAEGRHDQNSAWILAENEWRWQNQIPVVRETSIIRAWRRTNAGRAIDLEFTFTALKSGVTVARRETRLYGGLNIRLAEVQHQEIVFHTDPSDHSPRRAWADLAGQFRDGAAPIGLAIFQHPGNPDYPGDWVEYPELSWFQPTFPRAETRYLLRPGVPLVLRFRLWVHSGRVDSSTLAEQWLRYVTP